MNHSRILRRVLPALFFVSLGIFLLLESVQARVFYVSTEGNDSWSGALSAPNAEGTDGPFRTLERAKRCIPILSDRGKDIEIIFRGGVYPLEKTVSFGPFESALGEMEDGTFLSRVIVRAMEGEEVLLTGGKVIRNFEPWKDGIFKTNVWEQGLKDVDFKVLVCDGVRQRLARWPNFDPENPYAGGWAYADGEYVPPYQTIEGERKDTFLYKKEDEREWHRPEELRVMVFPRYNWWNNLIFVKSIDRETRRVTLKSNASYPIRPTDRYYFENALEELDAPGEWYLDQRDGTLYFYPPEGVTTAEQLNALTVTAPVNSRLLDIHGAMGIEFRDLIFENAKNEIASVSESKSILFSRCEIRNAGSYHSTALNFVRCENCGIENSEISYIGGTAVGLHGGDVKTLKPGRNFAKNNLIHHTGIEFKQGVGVSMRGVGNRISNNEIHDCPRFGIGWGGQNHSIEFNHIHHVNLETCDTGAIYTGGRDWIGSYGTQIRYNYFHDILGFGSENGKWVTPHFCWGIYLDDNCGGVDVYGNVVVGCVRGLIHLHNGRDNHIWNNIFIDGTLNQFEASGWTTESSGWKNHFPTMVKGYESVQGEPAWQKMRNPNQHPKDAPRPDGSIMQGNRLWNNIFYFSNPGTKCFGTRNFNPEFNESDRNLIWNYAHPEARIQVRANYYGSPETLRGILISGGDFEEGEAETFPEMCRRQSWPSEKTRVVLDASAPKSGKLCLRIEPDYVPERGVNASPAVLLPNVGIEPGKSYCLSGWFRSDREEKSVGFHVHHYTAGVHYWGSGGGGKVGKEWKKIEVRFRVPGPGDSNFKECMTSFNVTLSNPSKEGGTVWADDVRLEEIPASDDLAYWRSIGFDRNSIVADPLFEDAKNGDYRLKKESPAWKLGFQPIPFEKIGRQPF